MEFHENFKDELKKSYDKNAEIRTRGEIVLWKENQMKKFIRYLDPEKSNHILDLGSGTGQYAKYFSDRSLVVTCIDLSPEMIRQCKLRGLEAYEMDFYNLRFNKEEFDGVWSLNSLLHVPKNDIDKVLVNIKAVLKPGGIFFMGLYGGENFEGIYEEDTCEPKRFFSFYTSEKIKEIVGKHFEIIEFEEVEVKYRNPIFQSLILKKYPEL